MLWQGAVPIPQRQLFFSWALGLVYFVGFSPSPILKGRFTRNSVVLAPIEPASLRMDELCVKKPEKPTKQQNWGIESGRELALRKSSALPHVRKPLRSRRLTAPSERSRNNFDRTIVTAVCKAW